MPNTYKPKKCICPVYFNNTNNSNNLNTLQNNVNLIKYGKYNSQIIPNNKQTIIVPPRNSF